MWPRTKYKYNTRATLGWSHVPVFDDSPEVLAILQLIVANVEMSRVVEVFDLNTRCQHHEEHGRIQQMMNIYKAILGGVGTIQTYPITACKSHNTMGGNDQSNYWEKGQSIFLCYPLV